MDEACPLPRRYSGSGLALALASALLLAGCCSDCAELSQVGAATFSGPAVGSAGAPGTAGRSARSQDPARARMPAGPSEPMALAPGGEAVGSGIYVNADGQILATWKAVGECRRVAVLDDFEVLDATVIAGNPLVGLVILQTGNPRSSYAVFRALPPAVNEEISAFTHPVSEGMTSPLTEVPGVVRSATSPGGVTGILQISAVIEGQSPGGPIVDAQGSVVGIAIGKLGRSWPDSAAYAIASARILKFGAAAHVRMWSRETAGPDAAAPDGAGGAHGADYTVPVICFR